MTHPGALLHGVRVVLIGGTSNTGKSTLASTVADGLGFDYLSTDGLARHPGRPWATPDREVPTDVAEHYRSLTVDELVESVLAHYTNLWPRIAQLVAERASDENGMPGLVLEGSALWPTNVATLDVPHTAATWLTADESVLRDRIQQAGHYAEANDEERLLMDKFLARSVRYQSKMLAEIEALSLPTVASTADTAATVLGDWARMGGEFLIT